jgi:N-acetylmuramoyl-L-alanine amidase
MRSQLKVNGLLLAGVMCFFLFRWEWVQHPVWHPWSLPLAGVVIYIDAGHGGPDGGAGDADQLEKDIALSVTKKLEVYLEGQGAVVILIREKDHDLAPKETKGYSKRKTIDLSNRLKMINNSEADLFLSVHLNSMPSTKWRGAQTFFSPVRRENKPLAKSIQSELIRNLQNTKREAKSIDSVYLLKKANKIGALVEIGFLSNPDEEALLQQNNYQKKVAFSIYEGVTKFMEAQKK